MATVRDWCNADYQAARRSGELELVYKSTAKSPRPTECAVPECDRVPATRGLCSLHYSRLLNHGDPLYVAKTRLRVTVNLPDETSPTRLGKMLGVSRQRAHQLLNKPAHNARRAVNLAVKEGKIVKPKACERCQKTTPDLEAHHWDYREVLDVRWLCPPCHSIVHPHHPGSRQNGDAARSSNQHAEGGTT